MSRTIILHYHLFKNAGTSVDQILQRNFKDRWVTAEFPPSQGDNSALVADWIRDNPDAVAFSTHTALGPVPQIDGVRVVSVMMLRDPVARIRSAYRFEQKQDADTWGAQLAKTHDLEGYVTTRLERVADRQCRNFQTHRLASQMPGDGPELDRALAALDAISVFGLVEDFNGTMQRLADQLQDDFPDFQWESVQANRTRKSKETAQDRRVNALLAEVNGDDLAVWQAAQDKAAGENQPARKTGAQ